MGSIAQESESMGSRRYWAAGWGAGCFYAKVFVYAQVLGVYGYAAVPRGGLWPPTPP
jgi:hypothetical protein